MEVFNIYLAGGIGKFGKDNFDEGNRWRLYCSKILKQCNYDYKVKVCNPNNYFNFIEKPPTYESQKEIMEFDLNKVRNADLIIVNFNDMYSLGTMCEIAIAYEKRIPIIGLDMDKQNLHPWQIEMTNRIFQNIDDLLDYVKDKYLM